MLSYYDALSYSVRRKSFIFGLALALLMMLFFALICFSLEKQFAIFSSFKGLLVTTDRVAQSVFFDRTVTTLRDILFRITVCKKMVWFLFLFIFFNIAFFSWQTIAAKKELFQQTSRSSFAFYFIAMGELLLLLLPLLYGAYVFFLKMAPLCINYLIDCFLFGKNCDFKFPYSVEQCIAWGAGLFVWTVYAISLFIGHFSFKSLLNVDVFLKYIKVVLELIAQIVTSFVLVAVIFVAVGYCYWVMDPIYFCFFVLLIYFVGTIASSSRWVFMVFFLLIAAGGFGLHFLWGQNLFKGYMITYLQNMLVYFSFFFVISCFFGTLAYVFASAAYVFRFNQTPATDVKEQSPEKLRRIDDLYTGYLKEHKNDVQDNFFHHMEE